MREAHVSWVHYSIKIFSGYESQLEGSLSERAAVCVGCLRNNPSKINTRGAKKGKHVKEKMATHAALS